MFVPSEGLLKISCLPSLKELQLWRTQGIRSLVNVSGVDLFELYPHEPLADLHIIQCPFADVFTSATARHDDAACFHNDRGEKYVGMSTAEHRHAFLTAVGSVAIQLQNHVPTSVFCHRGIGRSPLVAAAAFGHIFNEPAAQAIARTRTLHPPAQFTTISVSAWHWCGEQMGFS
jgi:hypothetical protein